MGGPYVVDLQWLVEMIVQAATDHKDDVRPGGCDQPVGWLAL